MYKKFALSLAVASLAAIGLLGCAATSSSGGSGSPSADASSAAGSGSETTGGLSTASTSLGTIIVDGQGMTVYFYDPDKAGEKTSTCTGQCIANWPAVTTASASPSVTGVSGNVGTIATPDGKKQITLDGLPLYTFAGDQAAGDTKGQGLQGIWWVVSSDGSKITSSNGGGY